MSTVFSLSSWGNAGIPWILGCLNRHPKIHAWSCMNYPGVSPLGRHLTSAEYLDTIARLGWQQAPVVGDLCAISWDEFPALQQQFGDVFRGAVLIGHPVQRLAGSFNFSHEVGRKWNHQDYLTMWGMASDDPRAKAAHGALGDDGDHVPASYMLHVNTISMLWNPATGETGPRLFKLEELLESDEAWTRFVDHLSAGEIPDYGATWRPLRGQVPNSAHRPFTQTPREVWDGFPEYVRRTMAAMLTPEARDAFESLGYDVSFVR